MESRAWSKENFTFSIAFYSLLDNMCNTICLIEDFQNDKYGRVENSMKSLVGRIQKLRIRWIFILCYIFLRQGIVSFWDNYCLFAYVHCPNSQQKNYFVFLLSSKTQLWRQIIHEPRNR